MTQGKDVSSAKQTFSISLIVRVVTRAFTDHRETKDSVQRALVFLTRHVAQWISII